jgi:alanyl-tRNA synthetase
LKAQNIPSRKQCQKELWLLFGRNMEFQFIAVKFGDSMELCGIHVNNTAEI